MLVDFILYEFWFNISENRFKVKYCKWWIIIIYE